METVSLTKSEARSLWLHAQRLDSCEPFGSGPKATTLAVEHLGYVQIDTINVIERCHHHILYNRIPSYRRSDLHAAQTEEKTVFEYWTHALSYVPVRDYRYYMKQMSHIRGYPSEWYRNISPKDVSRVLALIKKEGPVSIRDIDSDVLVEKTHLWGSRKPSKKALELGFYSGQLVISERIGMLKKYELTKRHFGWDKMPKPASEKEITAYLLDRSLRSQALVNVDSVCHLNPKAKPAVKKLIEARVKRGELVEVGIDTLDKMPFWMKPEEYERKRPEVSKLIHILSPFDPLIIQRKRLHALFDYEHRFEAYLPKEKRTFGYFTLPVLSGDKIIAVLDLKADRENKELLIQAWHWVGKNKSRANKNLIQEALHDFEKFQLAK